MINTPSTEWLSRDLLDFLPWSKRSTYLFILFVHISCLQGVSDKEPKKHKIYHYLETYHVNFVFFGLQKDE